MQVAETELGYEIVTPEVTILLGGTQAQLPAIKEHYPQFQFSRVKQIHCDVVVETSDSSLDYQVIADAHFSKEKNLGLCVVTADCVPVFFYDSKLKVIAGVHAGWRGVAHRIIPKTIERLLSLGVASENLNVVIGPHIQKSSFEVGFDVRDQILCSLGPLSPKEREFYFEKISENKALVDLHEVVKSQLQLSEIAMDNIFSLHIDTVTDLRFHSHRRDKEKAGRQVSFIAQKI